MKRTILVVLAVATLGATVVSCTANDLARYDCLSTGRAVYTVPADQTTPWPPAQLLLADGTAIDARGRTFDSTVPYSPPYRVGIKYHLRTGSRDDLCQVGGHITSSLDPENTPWNTWHAAYGMIVETHNFTVVGTKLYNQGDGISFQDANNWRVVGVRAEGPPGSKGAYIHDDCIENDGMRAGIVEDSKFDGCNVFMSSDSTIDGSRRTVQVTGSLVRLQAYRNSFNVAKYGEDSHGGFFKFTNPANPNSGNPPKLVVTDSIFRADQAGEYGGNASGFLALPPGSTCDNVVLVGTEKWQARDITSWTSQCTNLTFGTLADWNERVAAWDASHK